MAKTKTKKTNTKSNKKTDVKSEEIINKETVKEVVETKKDEKKKEKDFHVLVELNDEVFEADTDDIAETIKSFEPEILKTSVKIKVTNKKTDKTLDRFLYLNNGKKLFYNRYTLESFVKNLIF